MRLLVTVLNRLDQLPDPGFYEIVTSMYWELNKELITSTDVISYLANQFVGSRYINPDECTIEGASILVASNVERHGPYPFDEIHIEPATEEHQSF